MMFDESAFLAWVRQCPLSSCAVLAVDVAGELPEAWDTAPAKGRRYDLIVVGRSAEAREVARLMRRLKPGGSHLRMLGQCDMPPPGCSSQSKSFPGAGMFTTIWRPRG